MGIAPFDDQHQPMSTWLDDLATKEASNIADLSDNEQVHESRDVKYAGINSTWGQNDSNVRTPVASNKNRKFKNKARIAASIDDMEVVARKSLMSGASIDKMSSSLKKQFHKNDVTNFFTKRLSKIEKEFGKLGYIYVDPTLVDDCRDMMNITKQKVASIALRSVKNSTKCGDCQYNKRANCLLTGLKIADDHKITANEAKFILNKFASLKYVNKFFVKASDLTSYYDRLKSDSPESIVSDFLVDIDQRRIASEKFNLQKTNNNRVMAASNKSEITTLRNNKRAKDKWGSAEIIALRNKQARDKWGKSDNVISSGFKRLLLKKPSIRIAKNELVKHYGNDRVTAFMKESKEELIKFIRFLSRKKQANVLRIKTDESNISDKVIAKSSNVKYDKNKISNVHVKRALKVIYSAFLNDEVVADTKKRLMRAFNASTIRIALDKFKLECGSKRQAYAIVSHAIEKNLIDKKMAKKIASKFDKDSSLASIRDAIMNKRSTKKISINYRNHIVDTALKCAKNDSVNNIRKLGSQQWTTAKSLINKLNVHVSDIKKFSNELQPIINKSASDANAMLAPINQCSINILSEDDVKQSDATLFNTI